MTFLQQTPVNSNNINIIILYVTVINCRIRNYNIGVIILIFIDLFCIFKETTRVQIYLCKKNA